MANGLSIMIVEDHELARNGLVYSMKELSGFREVNAVQDGQAAIQAALKTHPDVILMDIGLPIMDGIEATQILKTRAPKIRIIMLTSHQEETEILAALAAGADAYCMKDISTERLIQVVEMVAEGAFWLDPSVAGTVLATMRPKLSPSRPAEYPRSTARSRTDLTDREMEVLRLLVDGRNNKEISEALEITVNTVKAHVASIIQKMAVDDRTQAALKALREGVVNHQR